MYTFSQTKSFSYFKSILLFQFGIIWNFFLFPNSNYRISNVSLDVQYIYISFIFLPFLFSFSKYSKNAVFLTKVTLLIVAFVLKTSDTNVLVDIPFSQYPFCEFTLELTKPCQLKMNKVCFVLFTKSCIVLGLIMLFVFMYWAFQSKGGLYATLNYTLNSKIFEQYSTNTNPNTKNIFSITDRSSYLLWRLKSEATKTQVKLCVLDCTSSAPKCVRPPPTLSYTINNNAVNFSSLVSSMIRTEKISKEKCSLFFVFRIQYWKLLMEPISLHTRDKEKIQLKFIHLHLGHLL